MKTIGVRELQHHVGKVMDRVAAGETITVSRHRVPFAKIVPLTPAKKKKAVHPDWMAQLKEIYGDKVLPDSQAILDEMREDRF